MSEHCMTGNTRKASIKESGEELSQADWQRFDAAVADIQAERPPDDGPHEEGAKGARPEAPDAGEKASRDTEARG